MPLLPRSNLPAGPRMAAASALALYVFGGCSDAEAIAWCVPGREELPVVASRGEGPWARDGRTPHLVELWRAGGLNEGEELAYPVSLSASPEGRIAITDFQLSEVVVIEPDGTWLGPWARRGEGPGELTTPASANWGRDGTLAIYDLSASKVLFLDEGEPSRDDLGVSRKLATAIYFAGELPWAGVQPQGGVLLQPPSQLIEEASPAETVTTYLLRFGPAAEEPDTIIRMVASRMASVDGLTAPGWPRLAAAIGTDGSIAVGGTDSRYRIMVFDSAGRAMRQLCRDAPPLPLTPGERGDSVDDDLPAELTSALRDAPRPDTLAAFGRLFWGARGRLWVQRSRASALNGTFLGVPGALYDVFDRAGAYLGEVAAPAAVTLQAAAGDTVFGLEVGDLDETSVVAYRLVLD